MARTVMQAMVHELLTLFNNRVSLEHVPNVIPELREVVLSPETDEFYANNMYNNFGDLAINIKAEVDELQKFEKTRKDLKTLSTRSSQCSLSLSLSFVY